MVIYIYMLGCWDSFISSNSNIFDDFIQLGRADLSQDVNLQSLELFVIDIYCKNKMLIYVKNLGQSRWYSFSKNDDPVIPRNIIHH